MGRKRREVRRQQQQQATQPFQDALALYRWLGQGQPLSGPVVPGFDEGEELLVNTIYQVGRFRSANVTYQTPGYVAFGSPMFVAGAAIGNLLASSATRRRAEREAAPQWRFYGPHACLLTTRRVSFHLEGRWEGARLSRVRDIQPYPAFQTLDMFYGNEPIRLVGPAAPWQAVAMLYLRHGVTGLHHPGLRPLAEAG
jgi:hypothetical protein